MTITFNVSKTEIQNRLQAVSKIIPSKVTLPILENILLDIKDGRINISAADYEGRMNTSIEGVLVENNISICIDPKKTIDALKTLPEQPISISIEDNLNIIIRYKGGKFEMMGKLSKEFPQEKNISDAQHLSIPSKLLFNGIEKTLFCSANDELRPIMNGVYLSFSQGQINFVASDGHKLALLEHFDESITEDISFVLPQKIATILKNMIGNSDEPVNLFIKDNFVRIEYKSDSIIATLIEGKYPNYRSVIPQNNDKFLSVETSSIKGAIKRVSVFSNPASSLVKLQLNKNKLAISAQDIDFSTAADETVDCEYSSQEMAIGFKGHFLAELISAIPTIEMKMSFSEPSRATLITPIDEKTGDKLTYLLMPMMLNN